MYDVSARVEEIQEGKGQVKKWLLKIGTFIVIHAEGSMKLCKVFGFEAA